MEDLGRRGGGRPSTGRPEFFFLLRFDSSCWSSTPPPPWIAIYFGTEGNIFCVSDVFTLDTVRSSETGPGRTSLVDDPFSLLGLFELKTSCSRKGLFDKGNSRNLVKNDRMEGNEKKGHHLFNINDEYLSEKKRLHKLIKFSRHTFLN